MISLPVRAFLALARRILLVGFLLFVPVCSFDFPEAWIFLLLFFIPQLLITFYLLKKDPALLERRLKVGPSGENRSPQRPIIALILLSVVSSLLVSALDYRFQWSHVPPLLKISEDVSLLLGFAIQFSAFKANSFASAFIGIVPRQTLASTGPYAVVRHPMYSGALLVNFSMPIALGSWWGLSFALTWLSAIFLRVLDEERLLRNKLQGYQEYCRKVPYRLIPHVW